MTVIMGDQAGAKAQLVIIQGPTASGKSELAVRLAEACGGEVVNADSMQVYRRMDIGTAKPSPELVARVPHHLYDIVDPDVNFTAADYRREAGRVITEIHGRGKHPILVGGTGLYIRTLIGGLAPSPGGDDAIRAELEEDARREGVAVLHDRLARVDPAAAARLHPNDRVRIVRALEVFLMTGKPLSEFQEEHRFADEPYDCLKFGISVERDVLYRRINERVDRMFAEGFVEEVSGLLKAGYSPDLKAMGAIGYKEVCAYLAGTCSLNEAREFVQRNTRRYAKRQLTWFRKDPAIMWVEYPANFDRISTIAMKFFG